MSDRHKFRLTVSISDLSRRLVYSWNHYTNDTEDAFANVETCVNAVRDKVQNDPAWGTSQLTEADIIRVIKTAPSSGYQGSRLYDVLGAFTNFDTLLQQMVAEGAIVIRNISKKGRKKLRYFVADTEDTPHGE